MDVPLGATAGEITPWDPPNGFTFVDRQGLEVAIAFTPAEDGCRVAIEERGFERLTADAATQACKHSWHRHLPAWFAQHVTQGER